MIKKLIALADVLDRSNHKEAADYIDLLVKNAMTGDEYSDVIKEWDADQPTVEGKKSRLPPLIPIRDMIYQLRDTLQALSDDPYDWSSQETNTMKQLLHAILKEI
jgi:hypothetical protein